jgi:hypothetical protein
MAYNTTTYLQLRNTTVNTIGWATDFAYNWNRIDLLGQHVAVQTAPGGVLSLRARLYDNSLVEAIRVTPATDGSLSIRIGRSGSNDRIIYAGSLAFDSITLANSRPGAYSSYSMKLRAGFENANDTLVTIDSQQGVEITMVLPTDWAHAKPWAGSLPQLELENSTTRNRQCLLKFTVKDNAGTTKDFVCPTYLL